MVTGSPLDIYSEMGIRSLIGVNNGSYSDDLEKDLGFLLRDHRQREPNDLERELNLYRSGSAPPTVEGSLAAITGISDFSRGRNGTELLSEDELRSDPAYLSYYYSNINQNPRLPPPTLSREDWRFARRFQAGNSGMGRIGDRRKMNCSEEIGNESLFSLQPGLNSQRGECRGKLAEFSGLDIGNGQRTFSDVLQDDLGHSISISGNPSHPASSSAFDDGMKMLCSTESHHPHLHQNMSRAQSISTSAFNSLASRSRSATPDPHPFNAFTAMEKKTMNGSSSSNCDSADLVATLSGMSLSKNGVVDEQTHLQLKMIQQEIDNSTDFLFDDQNHRKKHPYLQTSESGHLHPYFSKRNGAVMDLNKSSLMADKQVGVPSPTISSVNPYLKVDSTNTVFTSCGLSEYPINPAFPPMMASQLGTENLPPFYEKVAAISAIARSTELQDLNNMGNHRVGTAVQMPLMDPLYIQYLQPAEYAAQFAATYSDPSLDINYMGNSYVDLLGLQKAYLGAFFSPEKSQFSTPFLANSDRLDRDYYDSPIRDNRRNVCFPSGMGNLAGGVVGSWHLDNSGNMHEKFSTSLLEEFKGNRIKCSELAEIAGHVIEFSLDQYGSRFIQQKLETATTEEKDMIFQEIIPQALSLITDVFGNYVIQKFFEHGIASQRRELANKLFGHVLTLSLQMYGCRVIQKAIEVVDFHQQTKMVSELDGHVMRCVRDQNGNHVIQKCIECIPENAIQFIISSFYDHVVTLSTHPYGCRVIQRVLEHCNDSKTQCVMMDEILQNVSMLAQDQYGNYVIQHVLEHGKPHERSAIIKQLAGQIVHMSQQKFASNVVEKCLTFGGPIERQILVAEMLGSTDENEPLQAMMKDQFANYVVQKVLETCDNQQLELILSRIKVHLNALKKYTYGKHIVARVEKLVAAGERRIRVQSPYGR